MNRIRLARVAVVLWVLGCPCAETPRVGAGQGPLLQQRQPSDNVGAAKRERRDNEPKSNRERKGIQRATKGHPTAVTMADDRGLIGTISDNDDTGTGTEFAAPRK